MENWQLSFSVNIGILKYGMRVHASTLNWKEVRLGKVGFLNMLKIPQDIQAL
jgi:hypothetical protein